MTDYAQMDAEIDEELRAMYSQTDASDDSNSDSPDDSGTESAETQLSNDDSSLTETKQSDLTEKVDDNPVDSQETVEISEAEEPVVPESRYKEAVKAMNKAQREAAELRKAEAERDNLIQELQERIHQLETSNLASSRDSTDNSDSSNEVDSVAGNDLAEAKEYYPEVVNPLLKMIDKLEKELSSIRGEFGSVKQVTDKYQQDAQKSAQQQHVEAILSAHPDAQEITASPEYANWFAEQSPMIRQALTQGNSDDVIMALRLFKTDHPELNKPVSARPKADKLAAAKKVAAPNVKGAAKPGANKQSFTREQISKMSNEEFRKYESAIDEALARGEIA